MGICIPFEVQKKSDRIEGDYLHEDGCKGKYMISEFCSAYYAQDFAIRHRLDGPALIYHHPHDKSDDMNWYYQGERHRTDGPARIYRNGRKQYYLFGEKLSKKKWAEQVKYLAFK